MPRTKVRPENRQRAVRACIPCQNSKKRCDSNTPCKNCIRRDCVAACVYQKSVAGASTSRASQPESQHPTNAKTIQAAAEEIRSDAADPDTVVVMGGSAISVDGPSQHQTPVLPVPSVTQPTAAESVLLSSDNPTPMGRMMFNSKGEKVYVGHSASLSFVEFLRQVVMHHLGPSAFTQNRRGNVMLESVTPAENGDGQDGVPNDLDISHKRVYIEGFFAATSGLICTYTSEEILEILEAIESSRSQDTLKTGIVYSALAIGAQCSITHPHSLQHARKYFSLGQRIAFESMLLDPSIDLICIFLLMTFYLLGACRRNAAFMYLGVAARTAHALGLHVAEQYLSLESREWCLRLGCWRSLRIMDLAVSSILSRPIASQPTRGDFWDKLNCSANSSNTSTCFLTKQELVLGASSELCVVLEEIMQHLDQRGNTMDVPAVEQILTRLRRWSGELPQELRTFSSSEMPVSPAQHMQVVGNLHVACIYYFAVIIITRPFLISNLLTRLSSRQTQSQMSSKSEVPSTADVSELAEVCVDSAVLMARTCRDALAGGLLLDNMCMVKAWIFSAGLILGFAMFADSTDKARLDVENAYQGAIDVLEALTRTSPQAQHYLDTLTAFKDDITRHREMQQASRRRRTGSNRFISQLLVIDVNRGGSSSKSPSSRRRTPVTSSLSNSEALSVHQSPESSSASMPWSINGGFSPFESMRGSGSTPSGGVIEMEAFDFQITEASLFDIEPFYFSLDQEGNSSTGIEP